MERPERIMARRIIGLDLSKKTFTGCILELDAPTSKPKVFDGKMTNDGWMRLCGKLSSDDYVALEGGSCIPLKIDGMTMIVQFKSDVSGIQSSRIQKLF